MLNMYSIRGAIKYIRQIIFCVQIKFSGSGRGITVLPETAPAVGDGGCSAESWGAVASPGRLGQSADRQTVCVGIVSGAEQAWQDINIW